MGLLDSASQWLDETLASANGESVTYTIQTDSLSVSANIGQTPVGQVLENGVLQTWQSQDFLISAALLVSGGTTFKPEVGHTITHNGNNFRVSNLDDGRCYRFTDPSRRTLRIHTKEIG